MKRIMKRVRNVICAIALLAAIAALVTFYIYIHVSIVEFLLRCLSECLLSCVVVGAYVSQREARSQSIIAPTRREGSDKQDRKLHSYSSIRMCAIVDRHKCAAFERR
jgi:hypothetical protein